MLLWLRKPTFTTLFLPDTNSHTKCEHHLRLLLAFTVAHRRAQTHRQGRYQDQIWHKREAIFCRSLPSRRPSQTGGMLAWCRPARSDSWAIQQKTSLTFSFRLRAEKSLTGVKVAVHHHVLPPWTLRKYSKYSIKLNATSMQNKGR